MTRNTSSPRLRATAIASAIACFGGLAACSTAGDSDTRTLRAGVIYAPSVPMVKCGLEPLSDNKQLKAAGLEIRTTDSGQLGAENELLEQASSGELDIALAAGSTLSTVFGIPELEMFEAYYLYDSVEDIAAVRKTDIAEAAFGQLAEKGNLQGVGTPWLYGERHIFGNRKLQRPADFDGLKLRVPETEISVASARALGASPTGTAYSELYLALQQGIVDAAEAPLSVVEAESFDEPSKVINLTGHLFTAASPLVNNDVWTSLTEEQQNALEEAFSETAESIAACVEKDDAAALAKWEKDGKPQVNENVDREALRKLAEQEYSEGYSWSDKYVELLDELNG